MSIQSTENPEQTIQRWIDLEQSDPKQYLLNRESTKLITVNDILPSLKEGDS